MEEPQLSFEEICPYEDLEVHAVLQQIAKKPSFLQLVRYMFPQLTLTEIQEGFRYVHSTRAFQALYIHQGIRSIFADSTNGLSYSGIKSLDKLTPYLFLSNHRDIILDSASLNILLFEHGFDTTHVAIGDNLLVSKLVTDLMKLNKSFIVHRNPPRMQLVAYSQRLADYVRHVMQEQRQSVWLAQRPGRTKDGHDQTHPGLLKMLSLRLKKDELVEGFRQMNVLPMAMSYEYEPCDGLKAEELVHEQLGLPYEKDDKQSIIMGIRQPKGRVHLAVGKPLDKELDALPLTDNRNLWLKNFALLMDQKIGELYRLWPNNYIAADLLREESRYAAFYSVKEKAAFEAYLQEVVSKRQGPPEALYGQLVKMYAGPVVRGE